MSPPPSDVAEAMPLVLPVEPQNIPQLLKGLKQWVCWWAGPPKPSGKFDKIPVDPSTGKRVNALDELNWLDFDTAMRAVQSGVGSGVGFVLSAAHPIIFDGNPAYLTAIDIDNCIDTMRAQNQLWLELGKPYAEFSPSGKGLRMFGLCDHPLKGGNAGQGRELYVSKRFVTVTGAYIGGEIRETSAALASIHDEWFPVKDKSLSEPDIQSITRPWPECAQNIQQVRSMLACIAADTTYEVWRNVVWALASTGWDCAGDLAHEWSKTAPHRYKDGAVKLDSLLFEFKPGGGIGVGTLVYYARAGGWQGKPDFLDAVTLGLVRPGGAQLAPQLPPPPYEEALAALKAHGSSLLIPLPPSSLAAPAAPAHAPPLPPPPSPFTMPKRRLITADELCALPPTPFVVRGILPAVGLAAIFGEPGSGKSFVALDLAHAISAGRPMWFGFPVRRAPVAYVALEGQAGLAKRIEALNKHLDQPCSDKLRFWPDAFNLLVAENVTELAKEVLAAVGAGAVIIIDTLNQASPGADENASQDMGRIIASGKQLAAMVGGLVVFVHHAGKSRSAGLRGHSSLNAAMDTVIEVTKDQASRSWGLAKAKDDSSDVWRPFELRTYEVGSDAYGPVTSCAVVQTVTTGPVAAKRPPTGKNQIAALTVLGIALATPGATMTFANACHVVAAALPPATKRPPERAREAVNSLIQSHHLVRDDQGQIHLS